MNDLKQILINYKICIDNEWLTKYVELIYNNIDSSPIKYRTQGHHVIPLYYYRWANEKNNNKGREELEKIAAKDENNFIVNLIYTDHILAHYYLALCACNSIDLYANIKTIKFIANNKFNDANISSKQYIMECLNDFINNLSLYQELYEKAMKEQVNFQPKEKMKCISLNGVNKRVTLSKLSEYLDNGWQLGWVYSDLYIQTHSKPHSDVTRQKMSNSHKGKPSNMLGKHFSDETIEKLKLVHKGKNNGMYGKKHSKEVCQKISEHMQLKYNITEEIKDTIISLYTKNKKSLHYISKHLHVGVKSVMRVLYNEGLLSEYDLKNKYKS